MAVRGQHPVVVERGDAGPERAPFEHRLLVALHGGVEGRRGRDLPAGRRRQYGGHREREFGGVPHREVDALPGERGHQVRRVPDQGDARAARPAQADRQHLQRLGAQGVVAGGQGVPELRCPVGEVPGDGGAGARRVVLGEAGHPQPVLGAAEEGVDADPAVTVALEDQALVVVEREQAPVAHGGGGPGSGPVGVGDAQLDQADAGVVRLHRGEQRADPGVRALGADQQVAELDGAVVEVQPVPAVAERLGTVEAVAPADGGGGERVQQQSAQVAPVDLRALPRVGPAGRTGPVRAARRARRTGGVRSGAVAEAAGGGSVLVDDAELRALGPGLRPELLGQARLLDGAPAGVTVQVEGPALAADVPVGLALVHGDGDAVDLEDPGQGEAGGATADDGDPRGRTGRTGRTGRSGSCCPSGHAAQFSF